MDKNREVRRGGVLGKRHVSATRRSRASTGFKYSSVVSNNDDGDEMVEKSPSPNPRLQENNKERTSKKHSGRMSPSLQEVSDCWRDPERERSQSKRKRMEVQNHLSSSAKEMDDNSDDNTEIGRSEDDDDLPPPTVARRPWKLKLHGKPREDLSPINPAAVPRRLRTAMTKRQQESSSHSHVADITKQRHSNDVGAIVMSTPTSSNLAVNPGRKKKSDNHKPPTAKLTKITSKVSKTEVEVAETLYDLARMFTAQTMPSPPETNAEPIIAAKSGLATSATGRDLKQSPVASNADAASPSSSLAQSQSGVMKKKRPRMSLKTKDEGLTSSSGACIPTEIASVEQALCPHSEKGQSPTEPRASPKSGVPVAPVIGSTTTSPDIKADVENLETLEAKSTRMEAISPSVEIKSSSDLPEKLSMSTAGGPVDVANKDIKLEETLVTMEDTQKPEVENRSLEPAPKEDGSVNKFEIDLMVPPEGTDKVDETLDSNIPDAQNKEQTLHDNQKGNGNLDCNMTNAKVKEEVNLAAVSSAEIITSVDKDRKKVDNSKNMELDKENKQPTESLEPDESNQKPETDNGIVRERNNKVDGSKDRSKQDMVKQTQRGTCNDDSVAHKCDPNASTKTIATSDLKSTQIPVSMAGWAGFPPISYYPWPAPLPITGMPSCENSRLPSQLPSFFFPPRQARKRCATHVYITHFIDSHQHIKSNPLWAVAYGNPTALYANGLMGPPVSSALEPGIRPHDLPVPCLKVKEPTGAGSASANVHGVKERANSSGVDTLELKSSLEKQTQAAHKNPSLNDPVLGLPINTTSAPVSGSSTGTPNTTGSNISVTAAMFSGGSSVSTSSPPVSTTRNGLLDGSVASAAAFNAQLLNPVIQQPTFPFSISTGPFGSAYNGHLVPQQVPQIFSNAYYDTHMVSQQLVNTTSSNTTQKQPKNSQGSFPSGSAQSQHQETLMPSQAVLSATGVSLQQPKQVNEKNVTTDSRSTKKQLPIVQRNMYTPNFPAVHVTNINSTSALSMSSQDFSLMANFGGKQTGKMKQQAQAQVIPQQQLTAQAQKQQKAYLPTQYHVPELKEFDSRVSHSSLNRGPMHADLVGLSGVASIMTPQSELLHSMVDLRGHGQSQKSVHNQTTTGQSQQYSMPVGHDQKMHQRQHALMERKVTTSAAESVRTTNESLYAKVGHEESRKEPLKYELDQSNVFRNEWDPSRNVQGFQTNIDSKRANTVNSTMITFSEGPTGPAVNVGKHSTGQSIHFPGQNATVASQGLRRSHSMQDSGHMKTANIASAGPLLTSPSGTPTQAMQGTVTKSQGQQLRSEQSAMNSRISPASITSSASASSTLPALQSVSKSGVGALTKNSTSVKDSHSSLQKSPMASTTVKGISAANMASVMVPGQASTAVQTQISQINYGIQQQQFQQLRHHQTVQFMDSAQKHHGQTVLQNYPLVQNYSQQTNKHPSSQHLQFGQHILIHQPSQYEVGTQSQVHSQPMSQQVTLHHQQQFQQPPRQTASLNQHHKHIQPILTAPFSISTSGNLAHNIGTIDTGNALSIGSDGATTTANSTAEINIPCSSSKTSCNEGSAVPHGHSGAVSSVQHVSSSNTISVSYPNSLLQTMPNSAAAEKLGEKTNQ